MVKIFQSIDTIRVYIASEGKWNSRNFHAVVVCMTFANFIVRPTIVTWILSRVDDIIAVRQRARRFTRAGFTHNLRSWLAFITQRALYVLLEQSDPLVKVGFVLGNRVIKPLSAVWRDSKKGNDDYPERGSDLFLVGSIIAWVLRFRFGSRCLRFLLLLLLFSG